MRIKTLLPEVANQIAAGEVIERPASVVKELLENALDAGAERIQIEIGFGGLNRIKIADDGAGILADDLALAIAPHATSKIVQLDDLASIESMGFRGEALASIASVSRFQLCSKPKEQDHAMQLEAELGRVHLNPAPRGQGTTVEVRDLFYNAPVRKRFLKSERSEYLAIETVVKRFALSIPSIALVLIHNGKVMLDLPKASSFEQNAERIKKILGQTFMKDALYIESESTGMTLHGYVSAPTYQRSQADCQWIYLNRRMVKDKLLQHAIKQAYSDWLHPGRHPSCVLYLSVPFESVDVNVHPAKHEVRFHEPRMVHDFLCSQIKRELEAEAQKVNLIERSPAQSKQRTAPHPKPIKPIETLPSKGQWVALNASFVLVQLDSPYLVHLKFIQKERLRKQLTEEPLPWKSRPLFVPIRLEVHSIEPFKACLEIWASHGLEVLDQSGQALVVQTLPQLLPQLDIKAFFSSASQVSDPLSFDWVELLLDCHRLDARLCDEYEKADWLGYIQQLKTGAHAQPKGLVLLDEAHCQVLADASSE